MTKSRSAQEFLEEVRPHLGTIPSVQEDFSCPVCLGPVNAGFAHCYACSELLPHVAAGLAERIIPISSALKPGPWYGRLREYKITRPEYMSTLAAVAHLYVQTHAEAIAGLLGGTPTAIAAVPSTRGWQPTEQPLYRALDRSSVLRTKLRVLQKHDGSAVGRREYKPAAFPVAASLRGERVILVEDLWVTGAKAVSAAGALMAARASVVLVVIGREVNSTYTDDDHPYRTAMKAPFNIDSWPR